MSYPQRRTLVNIFTMAAVYAAYCLTAFSKHTWTTALKPWAITMLTFIGVAIIAAIIIQIVFHVLLSIGVSVKEAIKQEDPENAEIEEALKGALIEDERDKLLELKSSKANSVTLAGGLMLGLVSILLDFPPAVMLNLIYGAFFIGTIAEGIVNLVLYRKGAIYG
ncbi:MAG: hypothetical protein H0S79_16440 [Anaerolineaceae bacterium]|nr:hypothetical protein [Anaerolineaceae bacterium]